MSRLDPERASRRGAEAGRLRQRLHRLAGWSGRRRWDPVAGGRLLLVATGAVTTATLPVLHPPAAVWRLLGEVSMAMAAVLALSLVLPWRRLPGSATVLFPVGVWVALAVLGLGGRGIGASYTGLFVLGFAYLGLTQPPGTSLSLVPVALVCYVGAWGGWSAPLTARLLIAVPVWLGLGELLADLTGRQRLMARQLHSIAHTDALTGLPNRRDLDRRLHTARPGDSVVLCDLDHFKQLNDTLGHATGDRVLAEFGLLLRVGLREHDYAARYGGEEFALLLPVTTPAQAGAVLARLRAEWAVLHTTTFSAGIVQVTPGRTAAEVLRCADQALYAAKTAGRNRDQLGDVPPAPVVSPARPDGRLHATPG